MTTLRYLLDTDICIYVLSHRSKTARARFDHLKPGEAGVSVIGYGELSFGAAKSRESGTAMAHLQALTRIAEVLPLPVQAAQEYALIRHELEARGTPIGNNDLWIAAHAQAARLILVTNNEKEFRRVPGLKIENWAV